MYFPYLRGRQTELLALREFARLPIEHKSEVWPVIEPVKSDFAALNRAAKEMLEREQPFVLVMNPCRGDFSSGGAAVFASLAAEVQAAVGSKWKPAWLCFEGAPLVADDLRDNAILIFPESMEYSEKVEALISHSKVIGVLDGTENNPRFSRELRRRKANSKFVVRLANNFHEQRRNVDYLSREDEFFADDFTFYWDEGYRGVGDYTTLPKGYAEGGALPYAVAIHLTYRSDKTLRIHHFVSDSNLDQSNIQNKFAEAAKKVKYFYERRPMTAGVRQLLEFLESGRYPGLAALKKWSILNHLELMAAAQHREAP